jgi:hypothetical protein
MPDDWALDPPVVCRWLVRIASWIVPGASRPAWRRKWEDGLRHWWAWLAGRDELGPEAHAQLLRHCRSAWADALGQRFQRDHLRHFLRGPAFVLGVAGACLAVLTVSSRGFTGIRALRVALPYEHPEQLYALSLTDRLGRGAGVPMSHLRAWRDRGASNSRLAAYIRRENHADVTPNFFSLLGVRPFLGRTLQAGDEAEADLPAVLSYSYWRQRYGGERAAIGRTVMLNGRVLRIVGVLPPEFWALSSQVRYWTPFSLDTVHVRLGPPPTAGAIARIRPGVKPEQVRAVWLDICRQEKLPLFGQGIGLLPLENHGLGRLAIFAGGLAMAVLAGAVLIFLGSRGALRPGWRYLAFESAKTLLLLVSLAVLRLELTTRNMLVPGGRPSGDLWAVLALDWAFYLGCGAALYWCYYDQRHRCPVCLHRLSIPVTIGSWSSPLFDPVSTELLCDQGHGSLWVPETQSSASVAEHWTGLDESWRELFTK